MGTINAPKGAEYARILGVGGYRPTRVVTNAEIFERIDSSDEWIRSRSGIETRRWAAPDETVIDMASRPPARRSRTPGSRRSRSAAVLLATVTHPLQTPSAAVAVADRLGPPTPRPSTSRPAAPASATASRWPTTWCAAAAPSTSW